MADRVLDPASADILPEAVSLEQTESLPNGQVPLDPGYKVSRIGVNGFRALILGSGSLLVVGLLVVGVLIYRAYNHPVAASSLAQAPAGQYAVSSIPLDELNKDDAVALDAAGSLSINGQLRVTNKFVVSPSEAPDSPEAGTLYFDQNDHQFHFYDGTAYSSLIDSGDQSSIGGKTGDITLGAGLKLTGNQLSSTVAAAAQGVTSLQGQSGSVTLTSGGGITIAGTTISNSGVTSLGGATGTVGVGSGLNLAGGTLRNGGVITIASASSDISVNTDTNGNVTLTSNTSGASGQVFLGPSSAQTDTSNNPSIAVNKQGGGNLLQLSTGVSPVDRFVVDQSGSIVTGTIGFNQITSKPNFVNSIDGTSGDFLLGNGLTRSGQTISSTGIGTLTGTTNQVNVAGSGGALTLSLPQSIATSSSPSFANLTLGSPLTVPNGGTGAATLASGGIVVGNGTAALSSVVAGATGLCLISTAGAPTWQTCSGAGGVASLNSASGALTIAGASGSSVTTSGQSITINDATNVVKGLASFNSTNFSLANGAVNTSQDINTGASPTFGGLSLTGDLSLGTSNVVHANSVTQTATGNNVAINAGADNVTFTAGGRIFNFPTSGPGSQTICTTGISCASGGGQAVLLAVGSPQLDNTSSASIAINDTGGGDLLELQSAGFDKFVVDATGNTSIGGTLVVNTITPTASLTIGSISQNLTLQGATTTITSTSSGHLTTVGFSGTPTGNVTYNFDASVAANTYTICTTAGNCAGVGGGVTTAGGTANSLAKFTSGSGIGNSIISDNGSTVTVDGTLAVNVLTPTAALTVGDQNQAVSLQGSTVALKSTVSGKTNTLTFATPSGSNKTVTIPNATGTVAVSAAGPLVLDSAGNLTCPTCLSSGGSGGSAGVTSVDGFNGAITVLGTSNQINVSDASNSITLSLPQNINTTSAATFASLTVSTGGADITGGLNLHSGALTNAGTINGLTLTNNVTGFLISGGSTNARALTVQANSTIDQNLSSTSSPGFAGLTISGSINGQTISSSAVFSGTVSIAGSNSLALGTPSGARGSISFKNANNNFTTTVQGNNALTADRTLTLPDASGTICTDSGNCNGAGASLQTTYNASTSPEIVLTSSVGGLIIRDASTALGTNLFAVQNNSGGTTYLGVTALGTSVNGSLSATGALSGASSSVTGNSSAATFNNLTLTALSTGFSVAGGTTSKTLTVTQTSTIDQSLATTASPSFAGLTDTANFAVTGTVSSGAINGQTISSTAAFTGTVAIAGSSSLTLGAASSATGAVAFKNSSNNFTSTVQGNTSLSANRTLTLPDAGGVICTDSGNCNGAGSTLQTTYNNSTTPELVLNSTNGALTVRDNSTPIGANLLEVQNNAGSITFLAVTATGTSITGSLSVSNGLTVSAGGLNLGNGNITNGGTVAAQSATLTAASALTLGSTTNVGTILFKDGTTDGFAAALNTTTLTASRTLTLPDASGTLCTTSTCASNGSGSFVQNQIASAQSANFFIQSAATTSSPTAIIRAISSQTGDLFQFQNTSGTALTSITSSGSVAFNQAGTVQTAIPTTANAAGYALTVKAGAPNSSTTGNVGGALNLQAGSAAGTGNNAGGAVSITAGTGTANGNGGALNLTAGDSVANGSGGNVTITSGNASNSAQNAGSINLNGGTGYDGNGGSIVLTPGGANNNGSSGSISLNGPTTVSSSGLTDFGQLAVQGSGTTFKLAVRDSNSNNLIAVNTDDTGTNTSAILAITAPIQTGGTGTSTNVFNNAVAALSVVGGKGQNGTGSGTAGIGSTIVLTTGAGGNATAGTATGGAGGAFTLTGGAGGNGTTGALQGGTGASLTFTSGAGGSSFGTAANTSGGLISIQGGLAGTGGSGAAGAIGAIALQASGGSVGIGTSAPGTAYKLNVQGGDINVSGNYYSNGTQGLASVTCTGSQVLLNPVIKGGIATGGTCGSASAQSTLQANYTGSTGGTTPEIKLDATRGGLDVQDADTSIANTLLAVRASNASGLGTSLFSVDNTRTSVGSNGTATGQLYVSGTFPTAPVGSITTGASSNAASVTVVGRYSYVVSNTSATLKIFDVSVPASPSLVGTVSTGAGPVSVVVTGGYAFVATNGAGKLEVYNVSNPTSPVSVTSISTTAAPYYMVLSGKYVYLTEASSDFERIDISNPSLPVISYTLVASSSQFGARQQFDILNGFAYIPWGGLNSLIESINLSTMAIGQYQFTTLAAVSNIAVSGRYAYVTESSNTLQVVDISNPTSMVSAGSATGPTNSFPTGIRISGRYAYVGAGNGHDLQVFDVSSPTSPVFLSDAGYAGDVSNIDISGRYLYATEYNHNVLSIWDLGGTYTQSLESGSLETGSLRTTGNGVIGGGLNVQGGLSATSGSFTGGLGVSVNTIGYAAKIVNSSTNTSAGSPSASSDGLLIQIGTANASRTTGNYFIGFSDSTGTVAGKIQGGASAVAYTTSGADYAEYFKAPAKDLPAAGEIVALDATQSSAVVRAHGSVSTLAGIVSTNPGFIGNGPICQATDANCDSDYATYNSLVALSGQVPAKVNTSNGPIAIGDPVTASAVTGEGAKATAAGYIVGYAEESLTAGSGVIQVLVRPQYFEPTPSSALQATDLSLSGDATVGGNVSIGGSASATKLQAGSAELGSLNVSGDTKLASLAVSGLATIGSLHVNGLLTAADAVISQTLTVNGHILTGGSVPTIADSSVCSDETPTISGTDTAGIVSISVPAGNCTVKGQLVTVTFATPFDSAPVVTLTPASADGAALETYVNETATGFVLSSLNELKPGVTYRYNFHAIQ